MGATKEEAEALILLAIEQGVTYFDTASSYGQGDSERILSRIVGKNDQLCLVTKIGKQVPMKARILKPVKGLLQRFTRLSKKLGNKVKQSRGGGLPVFFNKSFLRKEIDKSRRRLGVECIPMVMLHSVPEAVLLQRNAVDFLEHEREKGNIRIVGVSVDGLHAAEAALHDYRISAIQVPFYEGDTAMSEWIKKAKLAGKLVIAREVFNGIKLVTPIERKDFLKRNIRRVISNENIGVSLVGTTSPAHLREIIEIAKSC
jgi:aryl-alcohol dehydrogenase-like predicted oxidoreductase